MSSRPTGCSNLGSGDGENDYIVSLCLPWAFQHKRGGEGWVKIRAVSLSRSRHISVRSKCRRDAAHLPDNYVQHSASWLQNRPGHKTIWHLPNTEAHAAFPKSVWTLKPLLMYEYKSHQIIHLKKWLSFCFKEV